MATQSGYDERRRTITLARVYRAEFHKTTAELNAGGLTDKHAALLQSHARQCLRKLSELRERYERQPR